MKKRHIIEIKKEDLKLYKAPRMGVLHGKIVPDKTKYSRKVKHQNRDY